MRKRGFARSEKEVRSEYEVSSLQEINKNLLSLLDYYFSLEETFFLSRQPYSRPVSSETSGVPIQF